MTSTRLKWAAVVVLAGLSAGAWAQVASGTAQSQGVAAKAKVHADDDKGMAGEMPLDTKGIRVPKDVSAEESPLTVAAVRAHGIRIRANTPVSVRLTHAVSSGAQRNGDMLAGVLAAPVTASNGTVLKVGTPVEATVVSAARAGQVQSAGVLTLQVVQVGAVPVTTNVLELTGQEGHRDVADANPEKGTEAMARAGARLKFRVMGSGGEPDRVRGTSVTVGPGTVSAPR